VWILLLMIVVMPFELNPYLYLGDNFLGVLPRFTVVKLLGLVGLFWSGVQLLTGRVALSDLDSRQTRAFGVFLATVAVGGLASGAGVLAVTRLVAIIGLLALITTTVRTEGDLKRVVVTSAALMVAVFPYALRQMYRFGGRLGVGLHETNYFALVLTLLLPLPFVLARGATGFVRVAWLAATGVVTLELLLTGSRGGFVAFLVTATFLSLRVAHMRIPTLAGGAIVALVLLFAIPNPLSQRILASGLSEDIEDASVEASNRQRLAVLRGGVRMLAEHPLSGVGLGSFKEELPKYVDVGKSNIAHNTYLELAAELGLPGLIAFGLVIVATLRSLERSARFAYQAKRRDLRELALGMEAGLAGYLVGGVFLSAQYEKFFWLVMFLSLCLERIVRRKARIARSAPLEARP
jgi:O-antigen ligase